MIIGSRQCSNSVMYFKPRFTESGRKRINSNMRQAKYIFLWVFLYVFLIQLTTIAPNITSDRTMWANQIQYFLEQDPRVFDFNRAYGHPGTTLVALGSMLHVFFGISYLNALSLSISIFIAGTTAACAVICSKLHENSIWWISTTLILSFNRLYSFSTPPTAIVMPLVTLIVLAAWFLLEQRSIQSKQHYILWGCFIGLSAATRIDATILVGIPMLMLIWYRNGKKVLLPVIAGTIVSFFVVDPFLWYMPVQHFKDLVYKFTYHYSHYSLPTSINGDEWAHAIPLSVISIVCSLVILNRRPRLLVMPFQIFITLLGITFLASVIIYTSKFQAIRYFYPVIIVWEILLPLFALQLLSNINKYESSDINLFNKNRSLVVLCFIFVSQIASYLIP